MQNLVNRVQLIGRLGMDPETRNFDNGTVMTRFSLATDNSYKGADGQKVQDTQWHTLVAWNKTAELAQKLLAKGKEVAIEGKLTSRSYEDKAGNKRYATEVRVDQFLLFGKKGE